MCSQLGYQKPQSQKAVESLRELILTGELAAGSDHLESELATRLNMSRTPIREASLVLETQGLLRVRPRKGVRILSLSLLDMREIYEVLTALECRAAYRAAQAKPSAAELTDLCACVDAMEHGLSVSDLSLWEKADEQFHDELLRLSGNSRIMSIVAVYNDQVKRVRSMTLHLRPLPHKSNKEHRELCNAIAAGDAEAAEQMHRQHREDAQFLLLEILQKMGVSSV